MYYFGAAHSADGDGDLVCVGGFALSLFFFCNGGQGASNGPKVKAEKGNQELTSQFTSQSATGPRGSRGRGSFFVLGALVLEQDQEQDDDHGAGPTPPRAGARVRRALFGGPCSAKWL